jgi:aromatase
MHTENTIVMQAPFGRIFAVASDLSLWPKILPHYRSVVYYQRSDERNVVRMSARRGWIPVSWTSEQEISHERHEVRFRHLKSFTKGMVVVWTFTQTGEGVQVRIRHDLKPAIPLIGRFVADQIIGRFFIAHIAGQTLLHMKRYVELNNES